MSESSFERLVTDGFRFESVAVRGFTLRANFGAGYAEGARVGPAAGLLTWKVKIAALPDTDDYLVDGGRYGRLTRDRYLWAFYLHHNVANAYLPFWLRDPKTGLDYLAEIAEEQLDYELLCLTASATGLTLRQRRVFGVTTPGGGQ
jgi:hypothetical protein